MPVYCKIPNRFVSTVLLQNLTPLQKLVSSPCWYPSVLWTTTSDHKLANWLQWKVCPILATCVPPNIQCFSYYDTGVLKKKHNQPKGRKGLCRHTARGMLLWTVMFPDFSSHPKGRILKAFSVPDLEQKRRDGHSRQQLRGLGSPPSMQKSGAQILR